MNIAARRSLGVYLVKCIIGGYREDKKYPIQQSANEKI